MIVRFGPGSLDFGVAFFGGLPVCNRGALDDSKRKRLSGNGSKNLLDLILVVRTGDVAGLIVGMGWDPANEHSVFNRYPVGELQRFPEGPAIDSIFGDIDCLRPDCAWRQVFSGHMLNLRNG